MPDTAGAQFNPQEVLGLLMGFKETAMLRTALELKLFDAVGDGHKTAEEIAGLLGSDARATGFLLDGLTSTGLLVAAQGRYGLIPGSAPMLTTTSPRYIGGIAKTAASYHEWKVFGRLTETVRSGEPFTDVDAHEPDFPFWIDFAEHPTPASARGALMIAEALQPWYGELEAPEILDAGCGSGTFGLTLAAQHPRGRVTLQDWPAVLQVAEGHAKVQDLADRITLAPGDIFGDGLTGGPYDVVVAGNLLFLFDPERAAALVRRLAGALKPGGRLVIISFMAGEDPAATGHANVLNLLMLSWTPGGQLLTPEQYQDMAAAAGLTGIRVLRGGNTPLQAVIAVRPEKEGLPS
uniref:SsfM3 n=1 Tax=Streptomyces sp. SF2575 TaxID=746675 RepID=D6MSU9_9ACTN|nr:SsfM3 [Streptomyces sp. SF2575]